MFVLWFQDLFLGPGSTEHWDYFPLPQSPGQKPGKDLVKPLANKYGGIQSQEVIVNVLFLIFPSNLVVFIILLCFSHGFPSNPMVKNKQPQALVNL